MALGCLYVSGRGGIPVGHPHACAGRTNSWQVGTVCDFGFVEQCGYCLCRRWQRHGPLFKPCLEAGCDLALRLRHCSAGNLLLENLECARGVFFASIRIVNAAGFSRPRSSVTINRPAKQCSAGLEAGWSGLFFEHIHLRHLAIPPVLLLAGYILLVQHRKNVFELGNSKLFLEQREIELEQIHHKREVIALSEATLSECERIYQDIHDGIGSQLVKVIFSLRSAGPESAAVVHNLQACLQDLRLVIDAQTEANVDIQTTVFAFCVTQELHLEGSGLAISYYVGLESTAHTDPKVNLNVLRVLQESLNNTIKHSSATFIDVRLKLSEFHQTLTITDNGHG